MVVLGTILRVWYDIKARSHPADHARERWRAIFNKTENFFFQHLTALCITSVAARGSTKTTSTSPILKSGSVLGLRHGARPDFCACRASLFFAGPGGFFDSVILIVDTAKAVMYWDRFMYTLRIMAI